MRAHLRLVDRIPAGLKVERARMPNFTVQQTKPIRTKVWASGSLSILAMILATTGHAQSNQERFGNWMFLNENIPIARTYALDFKTYLEIFCDTEDTQTGHLFVRTVWNTDELYYAGSFPFVHQFDSDSPKKLRWLVHADVGQTILRGRAASEFVEDAKNSYILVIEGTLKELVAATFVLDGTRRATQRVLDECGMDKPN